VVDTLGSATDFRAVFHATLLMFSTRRTSLPVPTSIRFTSGSKGFRTLLMAISWLVDSAANDLAVCFVFAFLR
jgi:hypothetical protein